MAIKAAAPRAEECISYQMPAFRLDGRMLVWFGAATNHCSLFPGAYPIAACKQATELDPTSAEAFNELGLALHHDGKSRDVYRRGDGRPP